MAQPEVFEDAWINTNQDKEKWIRIETETGGLYRYNSETGDYDIPLPISMASITGIEAALAGKADSFTGLTGTRTIDGHALTFTNGILTGYATP